MTSSDVVVVGAGVIGASIAYHLSTRDVRVTVIDAADGRGGATAASAAQIRMHHSDPYDSRLAALSLPVYERWSDSVGGACGFRATGFAFLTDAEHAAGATTMAAAVTGFGVESTVLTRDRYARMAPALCLDGVDAVAFEARGGYADPERTTRALLSGAARRGATIVREPVTGLRHAGGAVTGVLTATAAHAAAEVVVAAGVRSGQLCRPPGVALPQRTRRIGWAVAKVVEPPPHVTIDDTLGVYFRPHGADRVLFGVPLDDWDPPIPADQRQAATDPDAVRIERARDTVVRRLPALAGAPIEATAASFEAYTPDGHALIGRPGGVTGLYVCTGFSGGGFKVAPAVGAGVAEEISTGRERRELVPYRPDRFDRGAALHPTVIYRNM